MMNVFTQLRALVYLKRISLSLAQIAAAQLELARIEASRHRNATRIKTSRGKTLEFGSFDPAEANARWQREREIIEGGGDVDSAATMAATDAKP